MQQQYWITKQTLSQKLGRKEDECIVSSDAELDAKLELFRNIQMSCTLIQKIINKYQESVCYLSQEINSMGKFLKDNNEDKIRTGGVMLTIGKSLIFCAQQQLILHEPLVRFYQELETFRQRAVEDTLQNVLVMEKARTEYRATLSWMKNVSQQLDPDTTKKLEKFKRVQDQVRRGKTNFDKQSLDCLQKIDLLAAARCNMFNHALSFYQNKLNNYIQKSAGAYSTISDNFDYLCHDKISNENNNAKILSKYKINCKEHEEQLKHKQSQFFEKETSLLHNITMETNILENSTTNNYVNNTQLENLTKTNKPFPYFCDNPTSKSLLKSSTEEPNEKLDKLSILEYKNSCNESSTTEISKNCSILKSNGSIKNENIFLPSALLKQSLKNATNNSRIQKTDDITDNMNSLKQINSKTSWMNLFEELDPLSDCLNKKYIKHKTSFV